MPQDVTKTNNLHSQFQPHHSMKVTKRDGSKQDVSLDKVTFRIKNLCDGLDIDPIVISMKVCSQIFDGVTTSQLDELAAEICIAKVTVHPDYGELTTRIIISNNHKNTSPSFSETIETLYRNVDGSGKSNPLISKRLYNIIMKHKSKLNSVINYERDYSFDYFAFKTLEKSYLMKVGGKVVERIQHAIMRVSLGMYFDDLSGGLKCYEYFSQKYFTQASPTWYHSGMNSPNFLSCFLLGTEDSIGGIYKTIGDCAKISKGAGGIGVHISNIRSRNSYIRGTNGKSSGIIPMLKVYNDTAKHVNQSGKRPGAFAMYLEPHHPDVMDFLELKKNHGDEDERARDLFLALWVSDLFMQRVKDGELWSLMDPDECKGLQDAYGDEYKKLYESYEKEGKYIRQVKATDIWQSVLKSQIETGVPYIGYKDAVNMKTNQQNLGTIKSSNLCVSGDTMILTDKGCVEIQSLAGMKARVWNGEQFSESLVARTNTGVIKMHHIKFSNNRYLKCTPEHNFHLYNGTKNGQKVKAVDLVNGDRLIQFDMPKGYDDWDNNKEAQIYVISNNEYEVKGGCDTFCFNEPKRHMGLLNGVLTGNCIEIAEYSDEKEYACCCLASMCLPRYIEDGAFNHERLIDVCEVVVHNLNNIVDLNAYPVPETKLSNEKNRPLGVGVQGLADVYHMLKMPFDSDEASAVNLEIFETLYYGCVKASYELACTRGDRINEMRASGQFSYRKCDEYVTVHDEWKEEFGYGDDALSVSDFEKVVEAHKKGMRYESWIESDGSDVEMSEDMFNAVYEMYKSEAYNYFKGDRYVKVGKDFEDLKPLMVAEFEREEDLCGSYVNFEGSPISKGLFQFDMWGEKGSDRYDWEALRAGIMKRGVRNSLLVALMPTASTSQIMGNNECIEPYTSNIYVRNTLAGAFTVINKHLIRDLVNIGVWSKEVKDMIITQNGSVQGLDVVPLEIQEIYKTAWEMKQKVLIDQSADRGRFICQTQSLNLFFIEPPVKILHSAQMYGWKRGLKTGSYYIRSLPRSQAQQFTIDPELVEKMKKGSSVSLGVKSDERSSEGVGYVSSPSRSVVSDDSVKEALNEREKERAEREKEAQKVMGRACSIFNPSCEACSS